VLFFCAWLMATGTHWDVVQVAAWSHMWARNLQTESIIEAFASTFSPEQMCGLCKSVQAAKNDPSPDGITLNPLSEKAPLLPLSSPLVNLCPPVVVTAFHHVAQSAPETERRTPPLPPPRTRV
jgi:hypothetical protein